MRLAQRYSDHDAELASMKAYITAEAGGPTPEATRLGISADEVTNINALRGAYVTAYNAYISPNTHNAISVREMRLA